MHEVYAKSDSMGSSCLHAHAVRSPIPADIPWNLYNTCLSIHVRPPSSPIAPRPWIWLHAVSSAGTSRILTWCRVAFDPPVKWSGGGQLIYPPDHNIPYAIRNDPLKLKVDAKHMQAVKCNVDENRPIFRTLPRTSAISSQAYRRRLGAEFGGRKIFEWSFLEKNSISTPKMSDDLLFSHRPYF